MEILDDSNDRLLYDLEQFLIWNNAKNYMNFFLKSMYPKIISGEIIMVLAPVDAKLAKLADESGKSLEQISVLPSGRDILENYLAVTPLQPESPIQSKPTVYTSINGSRIDIGGTLDQICINNTRLGNLIVGTISMLFGVPGQFGRLQQADLSEMILLPIRSGVIGANIDTGFDDLPNPVIRIIALNLSLTDIVNNCRTSILFNFAICDNDNFWNEKSRRDFPEQQFMIKGSWRNTYRALSRRLYTFGVGLYGRLGHGDDQSQTIPRLVEGLNDISMVACGTSHTAVISDSRLYTFGNGGGGRLGNFLTLDQPIPELVEGLNNVTFVACGGRHTAIIANRKLYTVGNGQYGQLGLGKHNTPSILTSVKGLHNVTFVACGSYHTAVIADGRLYTFGDGRTGQLGHGNIQDQASPKLVEVLTNVTYVACGNQHTAVISDNKLYTFGFGEYGQLGHEDNQKRVIPTLLEGVFGVTSVACGNNHTAIIAGGKVYTFGRGTSGQLGIGYAVNYMPRPTLISASNTDAELNNASMVACGEAYTAVISNGRLYTFGSAAGGLGYNVNGGQLVPRLVTTLGDNVSYVACGAVHTAVIAK